MFDFGFGSQIDQQTNLQSLSIHLKLSIHFLAQLFNGVAGDVFVVGH
jgi:hypothetical protein